MCGTSARRRNISNIKENQTRMLYLNGKIFDKTAVTVIIIIIITINNAGLCLTVGGKLRNNERFSTWLEMIRKHLCAMFS